MARWIRCCARSRCGNHDLRLLRDSTKKSGSRGSVFARLSIRVLQWIQLASHRGAGDWSGIALIGLVVPPVRFLYDYSWFVGFIIAFASYLFLMSRTHLATSTAPA